MANNRQHTDHLDFKTHLKEDSKESVLDLLIKVQQNIICSICQEVMFAPFVTSCGHTFCYTCLYEWLHRNCSCPTCREELNQRPVLSHGLKSLALTLVEAISTTPLTKQYYEEQKKVSLQKYEADMRTHKEAFPELFNWEVDAAFSDHSDNVTRCPLCHWELEEGRCLHCLWSPAQRNHHLTESDSQLEDDSTDNEIRIVPEFMVSNYGPREYRQYFHNDDDAFYSADSDVPRPSDEEFVIPDSAIESAPESDDIDEEEDYNDFVARTRFNITQNTVSQSHEFTEFNTDEDDYSDDSEVQQSMLWRPGSDRFRRAQSLGHHTGVPETPPPPYPAVVVPPVSFQPFNNQSQLFNPAVTPESSRQLRSSGPIYSNQPYVSSPRQQQPRAHPRAQPRLQPQSRPQTRPQQQQPAQSVLNDRQRHELGTLNEPPLGSSLAERMQQRREAAELARRRAQPNSRSQRSQPAAGSTASNPVDLSATTRAPRRPRGRQNQPIIINDEEEAEHEATPTASSHPVENPDDLEGPEVLTYSAAGYLEHDPLDHRPEVDMYRTQVAYHSRENEVYEPRAVRIFDNGSDEEANQNQQPRNRQQRQRRNLQIIDSDSDDYYGTYQHQQR